MKEMSLPAKTENLQAVIDFVTAELETSACPLKARMQIELAVEEIFVNIANYAYRPEVGEATVRCAVDKEPLEVVIQFLDQGKPYNPLAKKDADTSLPVEEREIGGLGILLVKKSMDSIDYEYKDGKNILTIKKNA
ncbi:MAG TPA: ATP-binding protein [Kiritimatiellia bacterium]|mgnify:FL=1|nr:ATP-binding protein [Kiritimatiellia bacterium]HPS07999.1 ATP-binding protein [Kiritimatiellia bacterium]